MFEIWARLPNSKTKSQDGGPSRLQAEVIMHSNSNADGEDNEDVSNHDGLIHISANPLPPHNR